jgi:hypothetical protein
MLRRVAVVRTDVSEELSVSIIRVTRIDELGTTLAVTSNRVFLRSVRRLLVTANIVPSSPILVTLMIEALSSSEMSVLISATRRNNAEDAILYEAPRYEVFSTLPSFHPFLVQMFSSTSFVFCCTNVLHIHSKRFKERIMMR